jgi:hypothetical protein
MKALLVNEDFLPLLSLARQALCGEMNDPVPEVPDSRLWEEIDARLVAQQRVSLLLANYASTAGVQSEVVDQVVADAVAHTHAAFQLVGQTTRVSEALTDASIDHLILKGVAWGALVGAVASRGAGDIDVLVGESDVHAAGRVFTELGFRPAAAMPSPTQDFSWSLVRFVERERTYLGSPVDVDLHWRISPQRHLFPSFEELYARRVLVDVGGKAVPTLSTVDAMIAACVHVYIDEFRSLRGLIDIVRLVKRGGAQKLPVYSRALLRLAAEVMSVATRVFPGVAQEEFSAVMSQLPTPTGRGISLWNTCHGVAYVKWATQRDLLEAFRRFVREARYDRAIESVPRFFGKRLLVFPPWSKNYESASLGGAVARRITDELRRRPQHNRASFQPAPSARR